MQLYPFISSIKEEGKEKEERKEERPEERKEDGGIHSQLARGNPALVCIKTTGLFMTINVLFISNDMFLIKNYSMENFPTQIQT